jgi:MFS family permease
MSSSAQAVVRPVRGAFVALVLLFIINMVNYMDRYLLTAVEPQARAELFSADDPNQLQKMGILLGAFMITYMITAPIFGWLSDRFSRWKLVGIGLLLWSLATWASGHAHDFWTMLLFRCLVGIGEAAYGPAAPAIIADLFPLKHRGKAITIFYIAIPVGSALGFVYGGQIQEWHGWRYAFYYMLPPGLILGICCFFMREPKRGESEGADYQPSTAPRLQNYKRILKTKSFLYCTLGMTAMTFAVGGITSWMPTYVYNRQLREHPDLVQQHAENPEQAQKAALRQANTIFGAIVVVSSLLSTLLGGWVADWLRTRIRGSYFAFSGVSMFFGFGFFLAFLYSSFPTAWIFLFLTAFFIFANTGPTNTILTNVIHPAMRQMAVAINIFIIHSLGDVISPWIIGAVSVREEYLDRGFLLVSGMIFVGAVIWWLGARHLEADTANATKQLDG